MQTQKYTTTEDSSDWPDGVTVGPGLTLSFLRNLDDCVKLIGTDGRVKFMNENGMCKMELPDLDAVRGMFWWDLWPADSKDVLMAAVTSAADGNIVRFDAECPTGKGTRKHWNVSVTPIIEDDGRVSNLLSISKEVV